MALNPHIYGILAEFAGPRELREAARKVYAAGYRRIDAFSPFPVEGLAEAVGMKTNRLPMIVLGMGLLGGSLAYFMLWWVNVIDYPMNVGGRPFHSWPYFIPITFELTILLASVGAVLGMLILNRLPEPYHPLFNAPRFDRATQDAFFLAIEVDDPQFDLEDTPRFLEEMGSTAVTVVPYLGLPQEDDTILHGTPGGRKRNVKAEGDG